MKNENLIKIATKIREEFISKHKHLEDKIKLDGICNTISVMWMLEIEKNNKEQLDFIDNLSTDLIKRADEITKNSTKWF